MLAGKKPMSAPGLQQSLQTARLHYQAGRLDQAERIYRQIHLAQPNSFEALQMLGFIAQQKGLQADAVALLGAACKLNPDHPLTRTRLGLSLGSLGRHAEAEPHLRIAVAKNPALPEAWNNLAITVRVLGHMSEALDAYQKAITLKPDYFEAIDRLGALVADTKGMPTGIPFFRRAIEIKPDYAPALGNLGLALSTLGKFDEAIDAFNRALAADPRLAQAKVGRALAYQQTYRMEEAAAEFKAVLVHNPAHHEARSGRLLTLNYLSGTNRQEIFNEHVAFERAIRNTLKDRPAVKFLPRPASQTRLRLAILSPDLRRHSVAYFIEPLLRHLDRTQFEVYLYHDHFQVDAMSERLRAHCDVWRNFVGQIHDHVETTIRADAPDIALDLAGHTGLSRLPVFARRIAPVQISYLGYPNTSGLRDMDFRLVDAITDPGPEDDRYHTEKLVRFSSCAWAYQPPTDAPEPQRKTSIGLGGHAPVVFGSFNNFAKVSSATLKLWARVLAAVPHSILLLKGHGFEDPAIAAFVTKRLLPLVDDPARIRLAGRTSTVAAHLELYSEIDVALDCVPYNGTTTTCEALWMGVPLITTYGDRHAARVSASLLTAAGHPEWIAKTDDDFVRIAVAMAGDAAHRQTLRQSLRDDLCRGPLLDHAAQATRFAEAMCKCWEMKTG
jgi:predicted O-linked N-acetylglucosamine transferase (SPINDLY family)